MKSLALRLLFPVLVLACIQWTGISLVLAQDGTINECSSHVTDATFRVTVIAFLILMIVSVFSLLHTLQRRFLDACRESDDLQLFGQAPFGVPSGTIRSMLALSIVFASIGYLAIAMLDSCIRFPDVMVGILGSVLGFYFGSRGAVGRANEEVLEKLGTASKERDQAVDNANQGKLSTMVDKARGSVEVARTLSKVLPADAAKKLDGIIDVVDKSLEVAGGLAGAGKTSEAITEVGNVLEKLKVETPINSLLLRAQGSFGKALAELSGLVPPLAIAGVVIAVGSRLAGAAYSRWVARILNAPYTPELFPPTIVDASVAMSIIRLSPIFSAAFADEIRTGDLRSVRDIVREALTDRPGETLWQQPAVAARFADQDELERGINELQRAAMTKEVAKDINPGEMQSVGDLVQFMKAIDMINADKDSQRDMDELVLMMDGLKKQGLPVDSVFNEALVSINPEKSS